MSDNRWRPIGSGRPEPGRPLDELKGWDWWEAWLYKTAKWWGLGIAILLMLFGIIYVVRASGGYC